MKIIQATVLSLDQKQSLFELWSSEYPERIGYQELSEFERYLEELSSVKHYLLTNDLNQLQGWGFTFVRDGDDWFGIIIDSKSKGKRFGTILLDELKKSSSVLSGWVIDHQKEVKQNKEPYLSPLVFYSKNGFIVNENIRMENDKISAVKIRWERR